jgi:hypothetical protein
MTHMTSIDTAGPVTITYADGTIATQPGGLSLVFAEPAPPMLIGSDRLPTPPVALYPRTSYYRWYTKPTAGIRPLPAARGILYHASFHDTPTSALIQGWLKTLPTRAELATPKWALPYDVILEHDHEPEGDQTAAAYLAGVDLLKTEVAAWNKAHPDGPTVAVWQTFTGYAQRHPGKLMADGVPATIANLWRKTHGLGVDMEKDTLLWPNGFTDPEAAFGWARDIAKTLVGPSGLKGVPVGVAEFGDAGPTIGLAARYTKCLVWFGANGFAFVGIYDTFGTTSNYLLSGDALVAAQAAVAGQ